MNRTDLASRLATSHGDFERFGTHATNTARIGNQFSINGSNPAANSRSLVSIGRPLTASRVTKKQVDPIKALFFAVLGLAAASALVYLLVHLSAILAPVGLAAWMVNGLFGLTGGAAVSSLGVGLKNFAAFLSSLGTDPATDERVRQYRELRQALRSDEA